MKRWWIGCSGFHYKEWRDRFYPPKLSPRKWFEYYCQFYNTVELNVTFYRFPRIENLSSWYERSPTDFRFTVKAPRLISHYRRFKNVKREVGEFYDVIQLGLREKLGCVLFQLHPQFRYTEENFESLLAALSPAFNNVIEFRHISWWNKNVIKTLKEQDVTFCSISYPGLPEDVIKTAPVMYYRFHGVPHLYLSSYSDERLDEIASELKSRRNVTEIYAYFNNDIDVAAVYNARSLQRLAVG